MLLQYSSWGLVADGAAARAGDKQAEGHQLTKQQMVKPGVWSSCLDGKLCCMSLCWPSSPPPGWVDAKGTVAQSCRLPLGCRAHPTGLSQQKEKKSHSANFLHFLFFLKHMCLRLYRLMWVQEGWWRISSRQLALPATGDGAPSHISCCWDWCIRSSPLLPFWCKGQHCIWLLHKPCKSHQHSSLNVLARSQQ